MEIKPRGSNYIVTGGASGIGYAVASALIKEGCNVVIAGRNEDRLNKAKQEIGSNRLSVCKYDITDLDSFTEFLTKCQGLLCGDIDGLINCAGISTKSVGKPGIEETENAWDQIMDIDLKAPVFLTRRFALYLRDKGIAGNIINIASAQGKAARTVSAYQMAKSSLIKLTRGIGKDFAKYGIVINGVAPGVTYSDMTPRPKDGSNHCKIHASGRGIEPEEIADTCLFLLSSSATSIIGDTILVDGGFVGAI